MSQKVKVYLFSNDEYKNMVFENISGITQWIEADLESNVDVGDTCEYIITISEMTREEIDALPEAD